MASWRASLLAALAAATALRLDAAVSLTDTVVVKSDQLEADREHAVWINLVLTQGATRVTAARAEARGDDFQNSSWQLTGNVVVTLPEGELASDAATLNVADGRITAVTASGAPARFAASGAPLGSGRLAETARTASGRARRIDYQAAGGVLRFSGDAYLTDGRNEITGEPISYELGSGRISAGSVKGTIRRTPTGAAGAGGKP